MRSRVLGLLVGISSLIVTLTACGSGDSSSETPTRGGSAVASSSSSSAPDPTPTPSPMPSEPEVAMTGPRITVNDLDREIFRFTLPNGDWELSSDGETGFLFPPRGSTIYISGSATLAEAQVGDGYFYRAEERALPDDERRVRRGADREVAGVEGAVFESTGPERLGLYYLYLARHEEALLAMEFEFPRDDAKARAWIEAVLASGEWL